MSRIPRTGFSSSPAEDFVAVDAHIDVEPGRWPDLWIPFDAHVARLEPSERYQVRFPMHSSYAPNEGLAAMDNSHRDVMSLALRFTTAIDDRSYKEMRVSCDGKELARAAVWCSYPVQPFEIELPPGAIDDILQKGLSLELVRTEEPLYILVSTEAKEVPWALRPQLCTWRTPYWDENQLTSEESRKELIDRTLQCCMSLGSLQRFGWMESCVLDGVLSASRAGIVPTTQSAHAVQRHWAQFTRSGDLFYGDDFSQPRRNKIYGIETVGPFGAAGQLENAVVGESLLPAFVHERMTLYDSVRDSVGVTTEGMLFLAYPLIAQGVKQKDTALIDQGRKELFSRAEVLISDDAIYQILTEDGEYLFRNWSRGVAWYLLGLVRCAEHLPESYRDDHRRIRSLIQRAAVIVEAYRRPSGIWPGFLDQPTSEPDSAGSAGIAAALAYGRLAGNIDPTITKAGIDSVEAALAPLSRLMTPDGLLRGVAQENKGGTELQQSSYRVIAQFGTGLLLQYLSALHTIRTRA